MDEIEQNELEFAKKQDQIMKMRVKRNVAKLKRTLVLIAAGLIFLLFVGLFFMLIFRT